MVHTLRCLGWSPSARNRSFVRNLLHLVTVDMRCLETLPGTLLDHLKSSFKGMFWALITNTELVKMVKLKEVPTVDQGLVYMVCALIEPDHRRVSSRPVEGPDSSQI